MDNDKQVTDLVSQTRDRFLNVPLIPDEIQAEQFSLEKEFAAARKNRNFFIPLILAGFLILAFGSAIFVSYVIDDANRRVHATIDQFEEIKLREVLDTAKKNQGDLDTAKLELNDAVGERDRRLSQAEGEFRAKMDLLNQSVMPEAELATKKAELNAANSTAIRRIRNEFDPKIGNLQAKVREFQKKVDEYDQRIGAMAKAQEELINNQQQLYNLEKKKLTDYYEGKLTQLLLDFTQYKKSSEESQRQLLALVKKNHEDEVKKLVLTYNPVFTEPEIQRLIAESPTVSAKNDMAGYDDIFSQENLWTPAAYEDLINKLNAIQVLFGKVKSIPFTNSVPKAIGALELRSFDIFQKYDLLWTKTAHKIREKNTEIKDMAAHQERLFNALATYGTTIRENGFVIDGRDQSELLVYIQKIYPVKTGDQAIVFRNDEEEIAKIELIVVGSNITAKVLSWTDIEKPVKAFDRILLNLK